jgi:hypothetical protein
MPAEFITEAVGISREDAESILSKAAVAEGRPPVETPATVAPVVEADTESETQAESADAS